VSHNDDTEYPKGLYYTNMLNVTVDAGLAITGDSNAKFFIAWILCTNNTGANLSFVLTDKDAADVSKIPAANGTSTFVPFGYEVEGLVLTETTGLGDADAHVTIAYFKA
jgi:hypothetical protein